jgi:hypothetical protein
MTAGDRNYGSLDSPKTRARATAGDRLHDLRGKAGDARAAASNAWYRAAGRRISSTRTGISNARNQRTHERGRRPRTTQAADAIRSSVPFYRNRINRGTGRPHRDDRDLGRTADRGLAQMASQRSAERVTAADAARSGPARHPVTLRQARTRVTEIGSRALGAEETERAWPAAAVASRARRAEQGRSRGRDS